MDNQRLFIFIAMSFVALLLFQAWQQDYGQKQPSTATAPNSSTLTEPQASSTPAAPAVINDAEVPAAPQSLSNPEGKPAISGEANIIESKQRIHVITDFLNVDIDALGGDIRKVQLRKFPEEIDKPEKSFELMTDKGSRLFVTQTGFAMPKGLEGEGPDHKSIYTVDKSEYRLAEGEDSLQVNLTWQSQKGILVTKMYTFRRGSYDFDIAYKVENRSASDWQGSFYRQMQRTHYGEENKSMFIYTYMGGVIYTPAEHYEKIDFSDMQDENLLRPDIIGGWVAMMQHYFVSAWIPEADEKNTFYTRYLLNNFRYIIGMQSPLVDIPAGSQHTFKSKFYVGPKLQSDLEKLAEGLELTVDYGFLTVIAKPLYWVLKFFHDLIGNWGWAIILLTMSIKLAFYKLSETSYRSMANMRKMQPRMKSLKERFGDDRQKLNQAMMELYKKEKINPLGGCLPILVQIPVFIALYWVLLESVEMRQAPFIFWIQDLSTKDPFYVLPLLMGATMFIQQKLNPAPIDPIQAKVMMALPVVFTVFFMFFPSGLVLYWVVNNTLSIAQQWVITKRVVEGTDKK